ncbi:MAG: DUF433 domain-containing protein [Gemmataceae bacterium]|nr:DUF433 domain-containing protein [Planctomycetia bacterium]MBX3398099.1 DUF433 domain-containing protein [Gemmataceae bacterium]
MTTTLTDRITFDPAVLGGKPTIRGLRIGVEQILRSLSAGVPEAELLADFPDLESDDFRACYAYAAELVETERVLRLPVGGPT